MDFLAVLIIAIGIILAPIIGYFLPYWKMKNGETIGEKKLYVIRASGIGILLVAFVIAQLMI
jgi:hypothetical protein